MNIEKKSQLTEKQLTILESEMQKRRKSTTLAYILWFFLGSIGIHQFYLGNTPRGLLYLVLGLLGWINVFLGIFGTGLGIIFGWLLITVLGLFLLYDLFTMSKQIRAAEEREEERIIEQIQSM